MASIALGYVSLSKFPINIARLRRYLEDMVDGKLPGKVRLLRGMDDIPAIERSLNMIVEQLSQQVARMEKELSRIEWLLSRHAEPRDLRDLQAYRHKLPGQTSAGGSQRLILDSVGGEVLADIMGDFLDLVETSAMAFEANGEVSLDIVISDWARFLYDSVRAPDRAGEDGVRPGGERLPDMTSSWDRATRMAIESGEPVDIESQIEGHIYCAPIWMGKTIIGALGFGYGDAP